MHTENLLQIYASSFRQSWELPALTDFGSGATMTYADLARRIASTHMLFRHCGIKAGDKIALMGRNSISWVETYMATLTYGAVIVPVLQDFNVQDAMHIINHSGSVMLFTNETIFDNMEFEKLPAVKAVFSLDSRKVLAEHPANNHAAEKFIARLPERMRRTYPHGFTSADVEYPDIDESAVAEINYTSGTTGFSKGVMLTPATSGATCASALNRASTSAARAMCRFCRWPMPTDVHSTCSCPSRPAHILPCLANSRRPNFSSKPLHR